MVGEEHQQRPSNQPGINLNIQGQIDGFIHSHYQGLASTFTPDDIKSMYDLYAGGNIRDTDKFYMAMTSFDGESYLLMIDDESKLDSLGLENFSSEGTMQTFIHQYNLKLDYYNSLENRTDKQAYELTILNSLENSGLKLYKGNSNFTKWKYRGNKSDFPADVKCN